LPLYLDVGVVLTFECYEDPVAGILMISAGDLQQFDPSYIWMRDKLDVPLVGT
jgi:hypothetical protein